MSLTSKPPRLFFEDRGDGDPLLLICGFGASSAVLDPLADLWSTRLRCITYDHPGTGRSSKRACPVSTAALAASAARVLDELEIEAAHVAGLSLGGAIAQELALRFPHRVRSAGARASLPAPGARSDSRQYEHDRPAELTT